MLPPAPRALRKLTHYHQPHGRHPGTRVIRPGRELVELLTAGRGWVRHRDRWVEVGAGALLWHVAGDGTIGRSDFDDPYRCLAVEFEVVRGKPRRVPRITQWKDLDEVARFARESLRLYLDEHYDRSVLFAYVYGQLLFHAHGHHRKAAAEELPAALQRLLARIDHDYPQPLTVAVLAEEAGWSIPHVHQVCRERLGETPHQLIRRRRLLAARERLASTEEPVKQIAVECGFGSASSFCNLFRKQVGCSPAAYRFSQWQQFGR